ncbi:unnamed protein product [Lampetra planeri]
MRLRKQRRRRRHRLLVLGPRGSGRTAEVRSGARRVVAMWLRGRREPGAYSRITGSPRPVPELRAASLGSLLRRVESGDRR